ncbi:MAG: hypothetical protein ACOH5I_26045 [Oligoflexus sp.]
MVKSGEPQGDFSTDDGFVVEGIKKAKTIKSARFVSGGPYERAVSKQIKELIPQEIADRKSTRYRRWLTDIFLIVMGLTHPVSAIFKFKIDDSLTISIVAIAGLSGYKGIEKFIDNFIKK